VFTDIQKYSHKHYLAAVSNLSATSFAGIDPKQVKVIENGVDLDRITPTIERSEIRGKWKCDKNTFVLGYLGRIDPIKNFDFMLKVIRCLGNNSKLIIYGAKTPDINIANKILNELRDNLKDQFLYYPPVKDVGSILNAIDALILPSYSEAMSLTLLEAWAIGTPVIATPVGIIPEFEKKYGKLTQSISNNMQDEDIEKALDFIRTSAKTMTNNAKLLVTEHFSIKKTAEKWLKYIHEINSKN